MNVRDRIVELRRVRASELRVNPSNWRKHPETQRKAMRGILDEVGYADALLARETPDGLMLIDGHLRRETTPDAIVPVLVLDLDEREADLLLATLDPLAAMAEPDGAALAVLLTAIDAQNEDVREMLVGLEAEAGLFVEEEAPDQAEAEAPDEDQAERLREKWKTELEAAIEAALAAEGRSMLVVRGACPRYAPDLDE